MAIIYAAKFKNLVAILHLVQKQ